MCVRSGDLIQLDVSYICLRQGVSNILNPCECLSIKEGLYHF